MDYEKKKRHRSGRKIVLSDDGELSESEQIAALGGWIECQVCCVSVRYNFASTVCGLSINSPELMRRFFKQAHFGCLNEAQRADILTHELDDNGQKSTFVEVDELDVRSFFFLSLVY